MLVLFSILLAPVSVSEEERSPHGYHQTSLDWLPCALARHAPSRRCYDLLAACNSCKLFAYFSNHSRRYNSRMLVLLVVVRSCVNFSKNKEWISYGNNQTGMDWFQHAFARDVVSHRRHDLLATYDPCELFARTS